MPGQRVAFGHFLFDPDLGVLFQKGRRVAIGRRAILLLDALLSRQGEIVTKAELMDAVWRGITVEESNLSVQIAALRKIIGLSPEGKEWIATIPRVGYRFLGVVTEDAGDAPNQPCAQRMLAVLPFHNLGGDPRQDFFADGLAEDIITTLSKVPGLVVVSRSSSFSYKGSAATTQKIARDLAARYVVEGSVRREGNRVRITAQLSDGMSGSQLWAERYDRRLDDIFAIQDEVARAIVAELSGIVKPVEVALWPGIATGGTTNMGAYECFLRGRAMQRGATQNAAVVRRAAELFRAALALDPNYAAPYAGLGMALAHMFFNRWSEDPEGSLDEAQRLVDEAVARDPLDPFAHGAAAVVAMYARDFRRWAFEVEQALMLNPNFAPALSLRAILNIYGGSTQTSIHDLQRARRLDPCFSHTYLHHLGVAHLVAGDYEAAVALFSERILLAPETDISRVFLCAALGNLGHLEEARQVWGELTDINPAYSIDRITALPFRNPYDLARITKGIARAGIALTA